VKQLINNTHEIGERSKDFTEVRIFSEKELKAIKCSDHRTISLIAHIAQIVARILKGSIDRKIEDILGGLFRFRRGKGTADAIGMTTTMMIIHMIIMMIISERTYRQGIVCVLIEWQMAIERVNWTKLMPILKGTCIN